VIYLDSSALLKLLVDEPESEHLDAWLRARSEVPKVSSELAQTEVVRACRRRDDTSLLGYARVLLAGLDLVPISRQVIDIAGEVGQPELRTLDAIHLASAGRIGESLHALVTYDSRLANASRSMGLPTEHPGV